MAYQLYNQQLAEAAPWEKRYEYDALGTTGVTSPQGYQELPDPITGALYSAAQSMTGYSPMQTNTSGMLYQNGGLNAVLLSSSNSQCDAGCLGTKSDPRNFRVKPLYSPSLFTAEPGQVLPSPYNVLGMYP